MKKIIIITLSLMVSCFQLSAQKPHHFQKITPAGKGIVKTRADNLGYWNLMIRKGLAGANPFVPVAKTVFSTSIISGNNIITQDSPDVPVTEEANTTQSENSIFVDPANEETILNSNNSTNWESGYVTGLYGADDLYSFDAGAFWGGAVTAAGQTNSGDPTTAIGLNGWWYVGDISNGLGQGMAYSTDQGSNWTYVEIATVPQTGYDMLDKNHLWIDNSPTSAHSGNLYAAWTNMVTGSANENEIEISRSTDHGMAWSSPLSISTAVSAGSHNQGVNIHTGPNGEVYVIWAIYDSWPSDEKAIGFTRSIDGGAVFEPSSRIIDDLKGIRTSETNKNMRVNSFPSMAVDISAGEFSGNIYIVWANYGYPGVNTGSDIDVYLIRSSDGGTTWSSPIRVNQDTPGLGKEHFFPWITCDPETGTLAVIYYDDRNTGSSECEAWVSYSHDAGDSWEDVKVSDVAFTPSPIPGLAGGYFGDYLGITARNMKVYPVWTDNRSGRAMTYTSPFSLGPAPNQPYVVYHSYELNPILDLTSQNMNYGDSLYLSLGLKNVGDQPASNLVATLSTESPYIQITDSVENYGSMSPAEIRVVPNGYSFKVSDSIPDELKPKFDLRVTDGDSTWISHFTIVAHAPALAITSMTVIDTAGNNNGRLDPGETADILVAVSNTGDFSCNNTISIMSTLSDYIIILSGSDGPVVIQPGQVSIAHYKIQVADEVSMGSVVDLTINATSGLYKASKTYYPGIGLIVEDWESNTFTKFPWENDPTSAWTITNIEPYEGLYCSRSGPIADLALTDLILNYRVGQDDSISFFRRISSEPDYDYLKFYIDNSLQDEWSGEMAWGRVAFPVLAGPHTFRWEYSKDVYWQSGQDCAWIDFIVLPPPPLPSVFAGANDTICANETYQLTGTAADYDSIRWTTAGDGLFSDNTILSPVYSPGTNDITNESAILKLTAYGTYGNSSKSLKLSIGSIPVVSISVSPHDTMCAGQSAVLHIDPVPNATILWSPGGFTTPEISVDTAVTGGIHSTLFKVFVTTNFNCISSDSALITFKDCTGIEETGQSFTAEAFPNPMVRITGSVDDKTHQLTECSCF